MSEYWKNIIQSRYNDGAITVEKVQSYVPKLITQTECDDILGTGA